MRFSSLKNIFYGLGLACAVLLVGCAPDPYQTISTSIQVSYREDDFSPRQWKVPSGQQIDLTLDNFTPVTRAWILMARPVEVPLQDTDRQWIFFEAQAPANTTQTLSFSAPNAPGEYDIILDPAASAEDGWVGKLVVYQTSFLKEIGKFPTP